MGLSASSLRIAMLTARKSSLEFEGQQINQQRLTLSNQTAALFNAMLTMQVPTPPDPSEFSKMVYTFNKGDGLSTLLNVSRNASGPYTHDVTYKGPKTDSVLMKKQLNNVGFKHENGQMAAVIDGMNYDLTLNGNEEKLNEYLKTKETYDNLKNIEAQMSSLQKMPSTKELTSQQMKQYFETLGLTSLETPQSEKVLDVQNTDDAFQNVYNAGNGNYSSEDVSLIYNAATSPQCVSLDNFTGKMLLGLKNGGNLEGIGKVNTEGFYEKYSYTDKKGVNYTISKNENKTDTAWTWTRENINERTLGEAYGISYKKDDYYFSDGEKYTNDEYTDTEGTKYTNISYNEQDRTFSYYYKNSNKSKENTQDGSQKQKYYIDEKEINIDGEYNGYEIIKNGDGNLIFRKQSDKKSIIIRDITNEVEALDSYTINDDKIKSLTIKTTTDNKDIRNLTFSKNKDCFTCTDKQDDREITYVIDNSGKLTATATDNCFIDQKTRESFGKDCYEYWYNIISGEAQVNDPNGESVGGAPVEGDKEGEPVKGDKEGEPVEGDKEGAPVEGDKEGEPVQGDKEGESVEGDKEGESVEGDKEGEPVEGDNNGWVKITKNDDDNWSYTQQLDDEDYDLQRYIIYKNKDYYQKDSERYVSEDDDIIFVAKQDENIIYTQESTTSLDEQEAGYYDYGDFQYTIKYSGFVCGVSEHPNGEIITSKRDTYTFADSSGKTENNHSWTGPTYSLDFNGYKIKKTTQANGNVLFDITGYDVSVIGLECLDKEKQKNQSIKTGESGGVVYKVIDNGAEAESGERYLITATFKALVSGESSTWNNDEEQDGYSYDKTNHTLTLTTPTGVIAQMLLRNQNNQRDEDCDKNITVNEMLGFYEQILKQFGLYGSSATYKTKLDKAKSDYLSTLDAKGVENPGENQALFNFIDANGKNAYIYVPLDYINKDGQVDSTYAYMYETSYLENQTETISQKANIIYDENGRIVKISFDDGTVVLPEVKTEQDEEAYNAAMVKYDYEKQVYDKEISDINAKTEVIAQQDKNLEIKLKSIDTQHSAISTEIEALNKVLQNNVKSSFGTFSA